MTYTDDQFYRLQYLLGKQKFDTLSLQELDELRYLVSIEQPKADNMSTDDITKLGLLIVGIYVLIRALRK